MAAPTITNPSPADNSTVNGAPTPTYTTPPALTWESDADECSVVLIGYRDSHPAPSKPHAVDRGDRRRVARTGIGINDNGVWTFDVNSGGVPSGGLAPLGQHQFYWRVYASGSGGQTIGPVWTFRLIEDMELVLLSPTDGGAAVSSPTLAWMIENEVGTTTYDVYFGTSDTPSLVSAGQTSTTYVPGALDSETTYYWQIVAHSAIGDLTSAVRSFTTQAEEVEDEMVIDSDLSTQTVVNTTTQTTLYSFTVPGGTLSTNRALRLTFVGDIFNNSGGPVQFAVNVYFGGVVIGGVGNGTLASDATFKRALTIATLISAAGADDAQITRSHMYEGNPGSGVPAQENLWVKGDVAVNSAIDQALEVKVTHNVAASTVSTRKLSVWLEKL